MKIQKSAEDYLETMLMLQKDRGYIRSIDVADHMGVTKPSVSYAVKRLREIVFYLTDHHLIRERIHHIDGSEYTVRSEFARKTEGSMDAMIQRLVEMEAPAVYKNIVKIPA